MNLVKVNAKDFGLEENKAKQITDMFLPMLEKMEQLEQEFNSVVEMEAGEVAVSMAKELRLKYVKVRTGTAKIHKELKAFYLQGGKFVDGWKNAQLMASEGNEQKLMNIEKHFENIKKEERAKLQEERASLLIKFGIEVAPPSLVDMDDDIWENYFAGVKRSYEIKIEAEEIAEKERIAKEKAEEEERKKVAEENKRLKKEAEEREKKEKAEKIERERVEKIRLEKEAEEKKKREIEEKAEMIAREKIEAEKEEQARKERDVYVLELKKERDIKEKIEAELRKKEAEEARIEAERILKEEDELQKGDSEKVQDLIKDLVSLKTKYVFKSVSNKNMFTNICAFLDKVIVHITGKANK